MSCEISFAINILAFNIYPLAVLSSTSGASQRPRHADKTASSIKIIESKAWEAYMRSRIQQYHSVTLSILLADEEGSMSHAVVFANLKNIYTSGQ